jgi:hypothetical protein
MKNFTRYDKFVLNCNRPAIVYGSSIVRKPFARRTRKRSLFALFTRKKAIAA